MSSNEKYPVIFQSGQAVCTSGLYEVVGAGYVYSREEAATCEFRSGDVFPDFQGRAVCWHLIRVSDIPTPGKDDTPPDEPDMHTPWQLKHK